MPRTLALTLLCTLILAAALRAPAADDKDAGWKDLVGKELTDHWTTKGNWTFEDGVFTLTPRKGESGWSRWDAYLWAKEKHGPNFEIMFDYKVQKGGNSGFYFRVADVNDPVAKGIEVQIYDSGSKKPDAKLTDHDSGGVIPGVPPTKNAAKPAGEWNTFHITVKDDQLTVRLNGETVNQIDLTKGALSRRPKEGHLGFQDHALPLSLRNIKVRDIK